MKELSRTEFYKKVKGQRYERFGNRRSDRGRDGFSPSLGMGIRD